MNKLLILSALMLTVACAGCKKSSAPAFSGTYKGVVLFSVCAHTAIQTLGPNYLGEDSWAAGGGVVYSHVFAVQNGCQFGNHKQGDTISFNVIAPQPQNCFYCMIATAVPDSSYAIQVVN